MGRCSQLGEGLMAAMPRMKILLNHISTIEDVMNFSTPANRYTENNYPRSEVGLRQQIADALHLAAQHRQMLETIWERDAEITRLSRQLADMTAERDKLRKNPSLEKRVETLEAIARSYTVFTM